MLCIPGDAVEIPVFEDFLPSSGQFIGCCRFQIPLLLTWDSVGCLSKGGFDAHLQGHCSHTYNWTALLTELRSLGPVLTVSPERCAVLFLVRFSLTQTMGLPSKQNSLTAFRLVSLMIIWNSVGFHSCRLMLRDVSLALPRPGPSLCAESAKQPLVPTHLLGEWPSESSVSAHTSCRVPMAETVSSARGQPSWPCVP